MIVADNVSNVLDISVPHGGAGRSGASRPRSRRFRPVRFHMTLAGWLFLGVSVLLGLAAVKSQAALMFVLFGGMMGALHVSAVLARRSLSRLAVRRDVPTRLWQNQTVHLGYYLQNLRSGGSALALRVEELPARGLEAAAGFCVHLPGRAIFRAGGRFVARRRGRLRLDGVRLSTRFPFGLILATRRFDQQADVIVWPAKGRLTRQVLHRGAVEVSSSAPSPVSGGQDEFFGLREYRTGDNPRWIHWRRSATRAVPVVREMSHPLPEVLWVVLDAHLADPSAAGLARRERMIRFAATLIDHALGKEYQVGLVLGRRGGPAVYPPAAGRGQQCALLDALAEVGEDACSLVQTLGALRGRAMLRGQVLMIGPDASDVSDGSLACLSARGGQVLAIRDCDLGRYFEDDPLAAREGR